MSDERVRGDRALRMIVPAMILASVLGYGAQIIAPILLPARQYVTFSAYWSVLFLCIAGMTGVQNEIARSARSVASPTNADRILSRYALAVGVGASLLGLAAGVALDMLLQSGSAVALTISLTAGVGGYALLAIVAGVLYGARRWDGVALLIVADPAVRGLLFAAIGALSLTGLLHAELTWLLLSTAVPFVIALALIWIFYGRTAVETVAIDARVSELLRNSLHTILASGSLGFMVAGMPLMIGMIGRETSSALVAGTILVVVLTRAPIVSPLVALQSYLTVDFRDAPSRVPRRVTWIVIVIALASVIVACLVVVVAPLAVNSLPGYVLPSPATIIFIVLSAGLVGIQSVTGAAVLARSRHRLYAGGWVVTALAVVGLAFVPLGFEARLVVALCLPPLAGIAVHLAGLLCTGARKSAPV